MNFGIAFAPLVPAYVLLAAGIVAFIVTALLLFIRSRGALVRGTALALLVLALANPSFTREDRDPIPSVVAVVIDKSPSQNFGQRAKQTEEARAALNERLGRIPNLDVRVVEAGVADGETDGTRLFSALSAALADVPPDRIAGAFLITDGRVHDVPADAAALGFNAPLHALVTGVPNERDRRVVLTSAPRFGIVGQQQTIAFRVDDQGVRPSQRARLRAGQLAGERTGGCRARGAGTYCRRDPDSWRRSHDPRTRFSSPTSSTARRSSSAWATRARRACSPSTTAARATSSPATAAARSITATASSCCSTTRSRPRRSRSATTRRSPPSASARAPGCTSAR